MKPPRRHHTPYQIILAVSQVTGVPYADIIRPRSRKPDEIQARRIIAYLCRERTVYSYPEIAREMNRQYHATAHAHDRWVRERIKTDAPLRALVARCVKALGEAP